MRTSAPFSPLRTLLLLLPFLVAPAVVVLGTPRYSSVEAYSHATVNSAPATAPAGSAVDTLGSAELIRLSRRESSAKVPPAKLGANRPQALRRTAPEQRWTPSRRAPGRNVSRANSAESVANLMGRRFPRDHRNTTDDPTTVQKKPAEHPRNSATSSKIPAARVASTSVLKTLGTSRYTGKVFPLGTSVSLLDSGTKRLSQVGPRNRKTQRRAKLPNPRVASLAKVPEVLRAQEPDTNPQKLEAYADGPPTITWKEAQQRLTRIGVTRYRLETWGSQGQFLFSCSVPLKSNPGLNRHFKARAEDPMHAVALVLDEIEHWKQTQEP